MKTRPYTPIERLACTASSEIWLVHDEDRHERVLKVCHSHLSDIARERRYFVDSLRLQARFDHPHLVKLISLDDTSSRPMAILEYVQGLTLAEAGRRAQMDGRRWPSRAVMAILQALADVLESIHLLRDENGPVEVVHHDVSPQNVLLGFNGTVKLTDFGLAVWRGGPRSSRDVIGCGSFSYLSPERAGMDGNNTETTLPDARSDLYALGILAWELLLGVQLHRRETPTETMTAILNDPPDTPADVFGDIPQQLSRLVTSLLAQRPDERPDTATNVRHALARIAESDPAWRPDFSYLGEWVASLD